MSGALRRSAWSGLQGCSRMYLTQAGSAVYERLVTAHSTVSERLVPDQSRTPRVPNISTRRSRS